MQGNIGQKSDETQVVIGKNKKIYVWHRSHETFMPQCLGQYGDEDRQSAVSVLYWGCITYKLKRCWKTCISRRKYVFRISEKYINVLDECLWQVATKHFPTDR